MCEETPDLPDVYALATVLSYLLFFFPVRAFSSFLLAELPLQASAGCFGVDTSS